MSHLAHNTSLHQASALQPRVSSSDLLSQLAKRALKHVPLANPTLAQHFNTDPMPLELVPPRPTNLVMHLAHHR